MTVSAGRGDVAGRNGDSQAAIAFGSKKAGNGPLCRFATSHESDAITSRSPCSTRKSRRARSSRSWSWEAVTLHAFTPKTSLPTERTTPSGVPGTGSGTCLLSDDENREPDLVVGRRLGLHVGGGSACQAGRCLPCDPPPRRRAGSGVARCRCGPAGSTQGSRNLDEHPEFVKMMAKEDLFGPATLKIASLHTADLTTARCWSSIVR